MAEIKITKKSNSTQTPKSEFEKSWSSVLSSKNSSVKKFKKDITTKNATNNTTKNDTTKATNDVTKNLSKNEIKNDVINNNPTKNSDAGKKDVKKENAKKNSVKKASPQISNSHDILFDGIKSFNEIDLNAKVLKKKIEENDENELPEEFSIINILSPKKEMLPSLSVDKKTEEIKNTSKIIKKIKKDKTKVNENDALTADETEPKATDKKGAKEKNSAKNLEATLILPHVHKRIKKIPDLETAERFLPREDLGLSNEQVEDRYAKGFANITKMKTTKSYLNIFLSNIFTFFNILCFFIAGALIWVGSYNQLMFMLVVFANMTISIAQEIKAKLTVQKISLLTAPTATVLRDGKKIDIRVNDVVLDDILSFNLGRQICADSIIIKGEVEVNESLLTGESVNVKKKPGDLLYSGSFISSGNCLARVDKIGEYNYSSKLVSKAKEFKKQKSELLRSINLLIKIVSLILIPLGILMFFNNKANVDFGMSEIIQTTAASIIGMIPSGMYLLTSMALAVGVIKLARKHTLVQDIYSIEMLSRTDVICLDKTGTITDGTMKVNSVIQVNNNMNKPLIDIIGSMLTALDNNNQTSLALANHFGYSKALEAINVLPFSSSRKLSAVEFKNGEVYAFGAPEFILKDKNPNIEKVVKQYAQRGFRVLVLASAKGQIDKSEIPKNMQAICLIVIEDHIRENAAKTLQWFKDNNVGIKIISGDNPVTVSEISKRVGVPNAERFISLEGLSKQQVVEAASKYAVFGRVSPEQKAILVKAIKATGKKVAMTGDGVNDILALKEADCSIAMASGSEAARNVSHVVLLDSDFASMPSIVGEGRRVINNISKSSSLFLMKTFLVILLNILCLCIGKSFPFMPNQMILLEFFVIGCPSFVLALQPNKEPIKGNFLSNLISKALPGAIILLFGVVMCYVYDIVFGTNGQFVTMASLVMIFIGLSILLRICRPFDVVRWVMFASMVVGICLCLFLIPSGFFPYEKLSMTNFLVVIVLVQAGYAMYAQVSKLIDLWFDKFKKFNKN